MLEAQLKTGGQLQKAFHWICPYNIFAIDMVVQISTPSQKVYSGRAKAVKDPAAGLDWHLERAETGVSKELQAIAKAGLYDEENLRNISSGTDDDDALACVVCMASGEQETALIRSPDASSSRSHHGALPGSVDGDGGSSGVLVSATHAAAGKQEIALACPLDVSNSGFCTLQRGLADGSDNDGASVACDTKK